MTKVLLVDHSPVRGGAAISFYELLKYLLNHDINASVICNSDLLKNKYDQLNIPVHHFKLSLFQHTTAGWWKISIPGIKGLFLWFIDHLHSIKNIEYAISISRPDIVHLNSLTLIFYLKYFKKSNVKTILHVRESIVNGYFGIRKAFIKHTIERYSDEVIFICADNKKSLDIEKGVVIFNPVDINKYNIDNARYLRGELGIDDKAPVLLYVGGLRSINGPNVFSKAFKNIVREIPGVIILLPFTTYIHSKTLLSNIRRTLANFVGIYSERQILEYEISKIPFENSVIQTGYVENIENYFCISDIVVVPFVEPHFARPVIEAGAAGIPVVASDIGGITEVVIDGFNGYLFEKGDSDDLTEKLVLCFSKDNTRRQMGSNNHIYTEQKFSIAVHGRAISEVYLNLIPEK